MCLLTFTVKGVLASARLLSSDVLGRVCVLEQSYAAYCVATGQVPQATLRARSPSATPTVLCERRAQTIAAALCCIALWQIRLGLRWLKGLHVGASNRLLGIAV